MPYTYKELNITHKDQLIGLLNKGFKRSKSFWINSINNLVKYQNSINDNKIGHGLFFNDDLVGAILIINDKSTNSASLSSLYVEEKHRARSLPFLNESIKSIKQPCINNFSATDDASKILKIFGFKTHKKSCNLRVPIPIFSNIRLTKMNENDAKKILIEKKIFNSDNLRVLKLENKQIQKLIILKDLSLLKNGYFRLLSSVIYSDVLVDSELRALVFYNFLRGKFLFDFFEPELSLSFQSKRFSIISKGKTEANSFGNSEYLLFDF